MTAVKSFFITLRNVSGTIFVGTCFPDPTFLSLRDVNYITYVYRTHGIAEGQDGVICLTKPYSYIKSNLTKRTVDAIAKCLLEEGLLSVDEHETITVTNLPRRLHVDHLLKKVILRGSDQLHAFIKALKTVNIKIAKTLAETEVTDQDRSRMHGSIILKFSAGDDFDLASLTPQLVQENMTDLLWKGYLETKFKITNPVHVTVFIMSPSGNGHDEIHFCLDFDAPDITTRREDYKQDIVAQERKFLSEELDPTELSEWITNQPDAEKTTKQMFEDKCSRSDMSRKEEMDVLLDILYAFRNGQELMKRFCAENDPYVYNKLFLKTDQHSTEEHESLKQKSLQYESGGGLQRLYSFWININTEQEGIKKLQETKEFQRATLDEGPSKSLQNLEVSSSGISHEYGLQHYLEYERQKSDDKLLEPTVWKYVSTTAVIQVGKLEEIWSDAMIIFGEPRSKHLPTAIIEMVGPQIQREFEEKYPNGLSQYEAAVFSGFNLPVWKILYCARDKFSFGYGSEIHNILQNYLKQAGKLMMQSIIFLVQEEDLEGNFTELSRTLCSYMDVLNHGTLTSYFFIDQDNFKWRTIRKITEDKLSEALSPFDVYPRADILTDATKPSANLEPKVFTVGHTTVIIQVGKLEKIQSDALVIFEVSKGQWPKQDLPSEILEKAGPMIQREFEEKFPAGLEYAEVAVLNGYNLPFRKILYGVLPRWPVACLTQVITKFATECLQLASEEEIQSIAFMIPSLAYHVAVTFAHVLYCSVHMPVHDKLSLSISTLNIVIKDGCTGGSTLRKVFEEEWAHRIEFKEGHVTVVIQDRLWEEILMKRREESQTKAILSEEPQEKAKISDSEALMIVSQGNIADILETIAPSSKNPFYLQKEEVTVLDGYNNPFKKIYCINYIHRLMVHDTFLECFNMAEKDKINSIIILLDFATWIQPELTQDIIHSLRIFVVENPSSSIRKIYTSNKFFRNEIFDDLRTGKVFKERHVTVVINAIDDHAFWPLDTVGTGASHKKNYVHVLCGVTDIKQFGGGCHQSPEAETSLVLNQYRFLPSLEKARTSMMEHIQKGLKSAEVSIFKSNIFGAKKIFFGTPELDRQDVDLFFYECLQKADGMGVLSIIFLVPDLDNFVRDNTLFARTLCSCVKRFAKNNPFSSIKRIYISIDRFNRCLRETAQVFEEELANKSGEDKAEDLSLIGDEPQKKKQEDIYMKQMVTYSTLPAKSKEGSKYFPEEEVD